MQLNTGVWIPSRRAAASPGLVSGSLLALALLLLCGAPAHALIMGGEGNAPVRDPGWPEGAAKLFNSPTRIAWWEGPPFGGGEWHAECRGNTAAFSEALDAFAAMPAKTKRLVVHDGEGASFWLNTNREPEKKAAAVMDWSFTIWQKDRWQMLRKLPADLRAGGEQWGEEGPPPQIDVYVGGRIIWSDVEVPKGIEVVDERLEAHGFQTSDGTVVEGTIKSAVDDKPLAAKIVLETVEPQPTGGYRHEPTRTVTADASGRWVVKTVPMGWFRLVANAEGFAPRVLGYVRPTEEPRWQALNGVLAPAGRIAGKVVDADGKPLAGVNVQLGSVAVKEGRYESPAELDITTNDQGEFAATGIPAGTAQLWVRKTGYCRPGLGLNVTIPGDGLSLTMLKSSRIKVSVDFGGLKAPQDYLVHIAPEGGEKVGSWGGSGKIDEMGEHEFKDVPPGRYELKGRPNPGSDKQESPVVTVDLKGGETVDVKLQARP